MPDEIEKGVKADVETPSTSNSPETTGKSSESSESSASSGGDVTPAGKTYTEEQLNSIMHERTKSYSEKLKDLEAYRSLGDLNTLRQKLNPAPETQAPNADKSGLDEDDKKFRDYLTKIVPELKNLGQLDESKLGFIGKLVAKETAENEKFTQSSEGEIAKYCESAGIKDNSAQVVVRDNIAAVILNTPELASRWQNRDASVIQDAIKVLESSFGKKSANSEAQSLSATKAKVGSVMQPLPEGGVSAPITKQKKMTDEERLDAAWKGLASKVA